MHAEGWRPCAAPTTDLKLPRWTWSSGSGRCDGNPAKWVPDLKVADLVRDRPLLSSARYLAQEVLEDDPELGRPEHTALREALETALKARSNWVRIS